MRGNRTVLGAVGLFFVLGTGCDGGGTEAAAIEAFGTCNTSPNYVGDPGLAGLNRFAENPVPVFVDMSAAPADLRRAYDDGVREGVVRWGRARLVTSADEAVVRIYLSELSPNQSLYAQTFHDPSTRPPFLTSG